MLVLKRVCIIQSGIDYTIGVALKVNESIVALATGKGQATDTGGLASALAPFKGSSSQQLADLIRFQKMLN